jgi:hypothetical protein
VKKTSILLLLSAAAALAGCGGLFGGGGGGGDTAEVMGNILDTTPEIGGRNVVVFAYRVKDVPADCTTPVLPRTNDTNSNEELKDGNSTFDMTKVKTGRLVLVFLLDNPGKDADGKIDPGDPVAVLDDPECVLDDVPNKYVIEATDIKINFGLTDVLGFPAPGRAEAGNLKEFPKNQK